MGRNPRRANRHHRGSISRRGIHAVWRRAVLQYGASVPYTSIAPLPHTEVSELWIKQNFWNAFATDGGN